MRGPERKGEAFICRYSWIPHQVRNDREGISGFRVAPGHPAPRCGVQKSASCGYCLCRYTCPGTPGFRVEHRVTPHHDAGSSGVSHPAQRCGVQWRGSPRTTMRGPERKGEAFICRYSWIPHQVRNDREGISGFRVAPGHPAPRCGVQCVSHPAQRCGVQRGKARHSFAGIPGFRIKCGMTWWVFLDSASHRVTPHSDAGSSGVGHPAPRCGVHWRVLPLPVFPGFRIKCGMTRRRGPVS